MIKFFKKIRLLYIILIIGLFIIFLLSRNWLNGSGDVSYGVTFSYQQAGDLGLDGEELFRAILDDLGVRKLRLAAYWDEIESEPGIYDWSRLDWLLQEAGARDAEIILAVGGRLPRWPECHYPEWTKSLGEAERQQKLLEQVERVIKRYRDTPAISAWQVENEPFLPHFGECPEPNKEYLDEEIALVRSLDQRPVVLTDSGELSVWVPAAKRSDIFGTTMYRDTYSERLKRYIHYPIEPGFFRFKRNLAGLFANPQKWLVIELQAEPWGPRPFQELTKEERDKTMNLAKFREIIDFSRATGFKEFYLWGVEWWYWEKEVNGDASLWEEARGLFNK